MRIKKLRSSLRKNKISLALIFSLDEKPDPNMVYFAGYHGIGILAVTQTKCVLFAPEMEYEKAKKTKLNVVKADKKRRLLETVQKKFRTGKTNTLGLDEEKCAVYLYKAIKRSFKAKIMDISQICDQIRKTKDDGEIRCIRKACNVTNKIFSKIIRDFRFKTEKELKFFIENEIRRNGCDIAFPPIVASGKNSSLPHYEPSGKITRGFLMLDFGAKFAGYCSDMTRMLYIGLPSKRELEDYELVLNTVLQCEKAAEEKKQFSQLFDLSLEILGSKSKYFTHALGHGLGLEIHETPSLMDSDKNKIEENIPFTVEPGIYFENRYGIRIEDTVILKNKRLIILTKPRKELIIIGK